MGRKESVKKEEGVGSREKKGDEVVMVFGQDLLLARREKQGASMKS